MSQDNQNTHGEVRIYTEKDGQILQDTGWVKNLGMTVRLPVIAGLFGGTGSQTAFTYLAIGTSTTAANAAQTTLVAELNTLGLSRAAATVSRTTTNSTNDTTQLTYTWTASGVTTVNECGYFNDPTAGTMGGRAVVSALTTANNVNVIITYKIIHT